MQYHLRNILEITKLKTMNKEIGTEIINMFFHTTQQRSTKGRKDLASLNVKCRKLLLREIELEKTP